MKSFHILTAALLGISLGACSDEWDRHYDNTAGASDATVAEMIAADPDLSTFRRMTEIAGYADLLASTQTFTVFAPTNEALEGIDLNDTEAVKRIVANHIARFNISTASSSSEKGVKMYNGKRFHFTAGSFGGAHLLHTDMVGRNGVLHILSEQIPYAYNLREYVDTHPETSLMAAFLARFDEMRLDAEASTPIGVDENGQTVYDSILVSYNPLFDHIPLGLGAIADEDSTFTMLIPTDAAWTEAYNRIRPYYRNYNADPAVADSLADVQASIAIVSDLIYRNADNAPSLPKLVSTSGSEILNPAALFSGTTPISASNGMIYLADRLNYDNTETWNKEIEVEGEEQNGRTPAASTTLIVRAVEASHPLAEEISEMSYLDVSSTSPARQPGVTLSLPDVLAGAYDIYASVVPGNVADATAVNDSTRLSFTLTYMGEDGKNKTATFSDAGFITSPTEMSLIKVAEAFEFPVANYYDRLWLSDETNDASEAKVTTTLYVTTNVSNAEFNRNVLTRRFRLDRIILVPIKN